MLHTIWGLFYPIRNSIVAISPKLMGIMPLFHFRQDADGVVFSGGILYFLLLAKQYKWPRLLALTLVTVQFALVFIFQTRSIYVSCLFLFLFLSVIRQKRTLAKIAVIIILLLIIGIVSNFKTAGRRGKHDVVSAQSLVYEFASIFRPKESGTASFRLLWWKSIIDDSLQNKRKLFLGRGFGPSLAIGDYLEVGTKSRRDEELMGIAKSPHNIVITIFGRMGLVGLCLWLGFNCIFFHYMLWGIKLAKRSNSYDIQNVLMWLSGFILVIVGTSVFGVLLESPFTAIPYFFFLGAGIGIVDKLAFDHNITIKNKASGKQGKSANHDESNYNELG